MSDTSKDTPEEYAAKIDAMKRGESVSLREAVETAARSSNPFPFRQPPATQAVPFHVGQTVWQRRSGPFRSPNDGCKFIVVAVNQGVAWCERHPDEPANTTRYETIPICQLTAIDPNTPEPVKAKDCPFCGRPAVVHESGKLIYQVVCTHCSAASPAIIGGKDAIAAWNSIHVGPCIDSPSQEEIEKVTKHG